MILYYPFFVANISGTLLVESDRVIIECIHGDLWNMVSNGDRDVTIILTSDNSREITGDTNLISESQLMEILDGVKNIRHRFRDDFTEGKSVLLEWSYAQRSSLNKIPTGEEYLVFYEARTV